MMLINDGVTVPRLNSLQLSNQAQDYRGAALNMMAERGFHDANT